MWLKALLPFIFRFIVCTLAFDDIYVNGEVSKDMINEGRAQYQLLIQRGNLPQYGTCWKQAVEQVDEGCKYLSEETQSDIALHLTNCFLEMSGHETYNCELNKKPNLRAICISNMSNRAFTVYTQFYTHTQNMCWFLRGQIWQETMSENTFKVGQQLKKTTENQEILLDKQAHSLELQEKLMRHGQRLEAVLDDLYATTKTHKEILIILTKTLEQFQGWVIGEISWFDSIIYYFFSILFIFLITTTKRTSGSRVINLFILLTNFLIERLLCFILLKNNNLINNNNNASLLYEDIVFYIWDLLVENNRYLEDIKKQNFNILEILRSFKGSYSYLNNNSTEKYEVFNETSLNQSSESKFSFNSLTDSLSKKSETNKINSPSISNWIIKPSSPLLYPRYNLRSKQNTPDRVEI